MIDLKTESVLQQSVHERKHQRFNIIPQYSKNKKDTFPIEKKLKLNFVTKNQNKIDLKVREDFLLLFRYLPQPDQSV